MAKDEGRNWRVGDTLATKDYHDNYHFGTIESYVETYGGPGYYLREDNGSIFFGRDRSLFVQCSFDGGGDPANQCDEMIPAAGNLYCPAHQKVVAEIEQHLTKLDALEDTEGNGRDSQ